MLIAYTGTHGTGKTTAVFERAASLKKEHSGKTVGIITEVASQSPYKINKETTVESQMWIFTKQISTELEMVKKYDIVVTDRTPVDCIAYTQVACLSGLADEMKRLVWFHMRLYNEINFKTIKNNDYWFADGVRDASDQNFRESVEEKMVSLYAGMVIGSNNFRVI